jgi:hypothetical protein
MGIQPQDAQLTGVELRVWVEMLKMLSQKLE